MKRRVTFRGKTVHFVALDDGALYIANRKKFDYVDVCPLCRQEFDPDTVTGIWLLHSAEVGIPNRLLHAECLKGRTPKQGLEQLEADYEEARKHFHWIDPRADIPY